jgi:hypothetical protein
MEENENVFDAAEAASGGADKEASTSESSTETEETSTESEGNEGEVPKDLDRKTPLHKDARFKRVVEEKNRLKRELAEARAQSQSRPEQKQQSPQQSKSKPSWFTKYFGDDEEAWQGFNEMTAQAKEQAKQEALAELNQQSESRAQEAQKWESWVTEQVENLEEEGESFERNALFKVMDKYKPTDDEGNLDFRKGLELLRMQKPESNVTEKRKAGAQATGAARNGSEPAKKSTMTPSDIRKWRAQEGF